MRDGIYWPTDADLSDATFSLAITQFTYWIPTIKLVNGKIGTHQSKARLTLEGINHIISDLLLGNMSFFHEKGVKDFAPGIDWIEAVEK